MHSLGLVERWSPEKPSNQHSNFIAALILGGMVFILLFTLASFAVVSSADLPDGDDLPFLEIGNFGHVPGYGFVSLLSIGVALGVFLTIMRFEYMKGHIGEKLPSPSMLPVRVVFVPELISVTALFYCAVTFLFSARTRKHASRPGFVFIRDRSKGSRGESFYIFHRRCVGMQGKIEFCRSEERILTRGGL